jgi:HlyD family secretion protein
MNKAGFKLIPFLVILIGLGSYFYQIEQVDHEVLKFTGNVEGKEIKLTTEVAGELQAVFVSEGQKIEASDLIFDVDVSDYDIQLKQLKLQQEIATLNYDQLLGGAKQEDIDLATSNKNSVSKQLSGAESTYKHAKDAYNDLEVLYDSGAVSKRDLDEAQLHMDQAYSTMKSLRAQVDASQASLDKVLAGSDEEVIAIAKAEIELRALEIQNLENTIKKGMKTTPVSGIVQTVNYHVGEYVRLGNTVVSLINLDALTIDVYVRERNLYQINVGDPVVITEDFLQGKTVEGKIAAISSEAEFTPKNVESKESKQEMVFKTTIEVSEGKEFLKPGMFVDVVFTPRTE